MTKTAKQIEEEIQKLEDLKTKVVPKTVFGDDNVKAIQAAIRALKEEMSEDQAYDLEDEEEFNERERENAVEAILWRDDGDEAVSESGWPLKKTEA